jgi:hypothetical protein
LVSDICSARETATAISSLSFYYWFNSQCTHTEFCELSLEERVFQNQKLVLLLKYAVNYLTTYLHGLLVTIFGYNVILEKETFSLQCNVSAFTLAKVKEHGG